MSKLLTIKDLMSTEYPEQKWLADRLIPTSAITIISGEPGSFKTYLLLDIALAAVQNRPLFGQFDCSATGVLMVDEENGEPLLQVRLKQLGVTDQELPIYFYSLQDFILSDESVAEAIADCTAHNINLVMFDSLIRIHTGDENRASDMAAVFKYLKRFAAKGITVLVTHHNRKRGKNGSNPKQDMRGSSDILASIDSQISLERNFDELVVSQPKQRYAKELKPFRLRINDVDDVVFSFEYIGDEPTPPSKDEVIRPVVLELLAEHGKLSQKNLFGLVKEGGHRTNDSDFRKLLKAMEKEDDSPIQTGPGRGKEILYSLKEEQEDHSPEQPEVTESAEGVEEVEEVKETEGAEEAEEASDDELAEKAIIEALSSIGQPIRAQVLDFELRLVGINIDWEELNGLLEKLADEAKIVKISGIGDTPLYGPRKEEPEEPKQPEALNP